MKNYFLMAMMLFCFTATAQSSEVYEENTTAKEIILKQKIKVFPNPASNVVNILGLKNSSRANITISDISGNLVLQHQWAIDNNSVSIPIPNLNAGIYVASIESEEQRIQTKFYKN